MCTLSIADGLLGRLYIQTHKVLYMVVNTLVVREKATIKFARTTMDLEMI